LAEAVAAYREAIRLHPNYHHGHHNLGMALHEQGKLSEAVVAYREALHIQPDFPMAHLELGVILAEQGKLVEAVAAFQEAIRRQPDFPLAYYNLGIALVHQKKPAEASAAFRVAIRLQPDYLEALRCLGSTLASQGKLDEAEVSYRRIVQLAPNDPFAHYNLGNALAKQGKLDEAVTSYRRALVSNPKYAEAHCNLGHILLRQGRFREALAELQQGHALGSKSPGWDYPSADWVRECERLVELDRRLPAVLAGTDRPADQAEWLEFAQLCRRKQWFRAAAGLYHEVFTAQSRLAADLGAGHRYFAACAAALAATGRGQDAAKLDDPERARLRRQALDWLRADLTAWTTVLDQNTPPGRTQAQQILQHWQKDPDLVSLRSEKDLARLPEAERNAWVRFWADVAALLKRAQQKSLQP
jgi:tetratricopeptide (TPR) repeat protein